MCVVTDAGGGIGHAVALGMSEAVASVVLIDQDEARCQATAQVLRQRTCVITSPVASPRPTVQRRTGAPRKYLLPTPKHDSVRANAAWKRVANVRKLSFNLDYYVEGYL